MGDKLIELIVLGFVLEYVANWGGEYLLPDNGKCKMRGVRDILFYRLDKRGFHLYNIILQTLNFILAIMGLATFFIVKERELTVLLFRIAFLFLIYTSVIVNLLIAAICNIKKHKK